MTDLDREQLKRECSDALKAVQQDKGADGLVPLAVTIADLGPAYHTHGTLMLAALAARKDTTVIWHLIQVLEKLEKEGTSE
jgi:hypothetical protein